MSYDIWFALIVFMLAAIAMLLAVIVHNTGGWK